MVWTLIIMMHVGAFGNGNSNALTNVRGFKDRQACEAAGKTTSAMAAGTVKEIKFVCVETLK